MDHNSFKNFSWTNSYQDADIPATGLMLGFVNLELINTSLNNTYPFDPADFKETFFMDREEIYFGKENKGIFLVNCSFNSENADNDDLGLRISYFRDTTSVDISICKWNSKGGNLWSINHSAILSVETASETDGVIRFATTNYSSDTNFDISNFNVNIIRLL